MKKKPPCTLSKGAKNIWLTLEREWGFSQAEYFLLTRAMERYDRLTEVQNIIKRDGLMLTDSKTGKSYANPMLQVEKDCMNDILKAWRLLSLKVPPPIPQIGRPPGDGRRFQEDD